MSPVLQVADLSISFGGLTAVDQLSFEVAAGEIFGLIGPNGAGKTTVFNCITQFYRPDSGAVWFTPTPSAAAPTRPSTPINLTGVPVHKVIGYGLVRTFQNVEIIPELSLLDNVLIGGHVSFGSSMLSQVLRLPRARREERAFRATAMDALGFLSIDHLADQLAGSQPYGVRKRLEIARTLLAHPSLIILDEPAAGLNEAETDALAQTLRDIRDEYQTAILLVEHDMGLVMNVCDRICAISFGQFLAEGTPAQIQSDPAVHEAYLGEREDA
ncbi:MAG: ABC transporter ATP-binding protein [Arachnia sp.]